MQSLILEGYLLNGSISDIEFYFFTIAVKKMKKRTFEIVMANYIGIEVSRQILPLLLTYG